MRPLPAVLALAALATWANPGRAAEFRLFRQTWGNVIVATDTTDAGRNLVRPTPAQPAYYLGMSLGARLGSIPGDQEPTKKELTQLITRILAKQGYVGARPGVHDPSLFLVVQWGYLQPETEDLFWFLGYDAGDDIAAPTQTGMLGAEVYRRNFRSPVIQSIQEDARAPLYGIIITAFDYASARTPHPVALWQTRVGLPANGKSMAQALPVMAAAAGPAIGRAVDRPVLLDADDVREGRVNLGELQFLDALDGLSTDEKP